MRISAFGAAVVAILLTVGAGCAANQPSPASGTQPEGTPYIDDTPQQPTSQAPEAIETAQAAEAGDVKAFTVTGDNFAFDLKEMKVKKDPSCPVCGPNATITSLIDYVEFCGGTAEPKAAEQRTVLAA